MRNGKMWRGIKKMFREIPNEEEEIPNAVPILPRLRVIRDESIPLPDLELPDHARLLNKFSNNSIKESLQNMKNMTNPQLSMYKEITVERLLKIYDDECRERLKRCKREKYNVHIYNRDLHIKSLAAYILGQSLNKQSIEYAMIILLMRRLVMSTSTDCATDIFMSQYATLTQDVIQRWCHPNLSNDKSTRVIYEKWCNETKKIFVRAPDSIPPKKTNEHRNGIFYNILVGLLPPPANEPSLPINAQKCEKCGLYQLQ
jgi:hypothetical protein